MSSIWRKETGEIKSRREESDAGSLQQKNYDIIVIGAGMAGILTAYYLQETGKKVLVLEANTIGSGQTEGTTAKITSQHGLKYGKLLKNVGRKKAELYARANEEAISEYERLIREKRIECQFERKNAYLYATKDEGCLEKEAEAAAFLGMDAFFTGESELPFRIMGAVGFRNQAQFQPLEFMKGLSSELCILEHTRVVKVRGREVITDTTIYTVDTIVMTTHYPFKILPGFYFLRQHQERSYCLALSGCKKISGMYLGVDGEKLSFRQAGEYLIVGGCAHRTGKIKRCYARAKLEELALKYFPEGEVEAFWAAQDCMPHDGIPYIGKFSLFTPNLYVATGFQKWGMTSSMVAARLLCDEICDKENPYKMIFTPQRFYLRAGAKEFFKDVKQSLKGLTVGIMGDKASRCTHMGCRLARNEEEKSFDCPCHGSRFDETGKVLCGPAYKDKNVD